MISMCNEFILWSVSVGKCRFFHENCFCWMSAKKWNLKVNFKWKIMHKSSSGWWLKECAVLRSIYFLLKDLRRPLWYCALGPISIILNFSKQIEKFWWKLKEYKPYPYPVSTFAPPASFRVNLIRRRICLIC